MSNLTKDNNNNKGETANEFNQDTFKQLEWITELNRKELPRKVSKRNHKANVVQLRDLDAVEAAWTSLWRD